MDQAFESLWDRAVRFRRVSPSLRGLVQTLWSRLVARTADEVEILDTFEALFAFLASPQGRSDANCSVVDAFFTLIEDEDWEHLPAPLRSLVREVGGTLHDSIHAPQIAAAFDSLPEQLLVRIRALRR